ncbi:MAG TPA: ribbon-helix-helix protein, CopG family [Verrucomicrobiae bacterium]|nr:ribbon-helix-helix protein, CopG family [Verrucomicrobiae bacterium]
MSFKISKPLDEWLETEARKLGRSKSDLVRETLERRRDGDGGRSVHDVMKHVCGVIKGGPRDVATRQRRHMKGFGHERRPA